MAGLAREFAALATDGLYPYLSTAECPRHPRELPVSLFRSVPAEAFEEFQYPTPPIGTSDSGFRAEVESEQALARGERLLAMVDAPEHHQMEGPAAAVAARRLDALGRRADFTGQAVREPARLKRIMGKNDPAVYSGKFITCVRDPDKALCEKARTTAAEGLPEHGGCQPLTCHNVALTSVTRDQWQAELDAFTTRRRAPLPPPPLLGRVSKVDLEP
ncbi:hypothetical protein [Streptomyces sp. NPDC048438]|uniref:hypothetical protein n=1 Tax=Streptomyces sp. NPDC048438 TaxID=3365551 RepID=UPI00371A146D